MKVPDFTDHAKFKEAFIAHQDKNFRAVTECFEEEIERILTSQGFAIQSEYSGTEKYRVLFRFETDREDLRKEDRIQKFQIVYSKKRIMFQEYKNPPHSNLKNPIVIQENIVIWKTTKSFEAGIKKAVESFFANKAVKRVMK